MFTTVNTIADFNKLLTTEPALLFYFSMEQCQVCKVLKPKIEKLIPESFPKIKLCYVNLDVTPEIAAMNNVFTVPTILIFFDQSEYIRKSRNFGLNELMAETERLYKLMFN